MNTVDTVITEEQANNLSKEQLLATAATIMTIISEKIENELISEDDLSRYNLYAHSEWE